MYRFVCGKYVCFVEIVRIVIKKRIVLALLVGTKKAWLPISEKTMPKMHDPRTTICGDSTSWA